MLDYKSPTTLETPEIHTILVETDDPEGPFGAKEAGQGPLLPVIPAIANAIYDAVGVRIDEVPITPDMILHGLELKRQGKPARIGPERIPLFRFKEPLAVESAFGQPADAIAERPFADPEPRHDAPASVHATSRRARWSEAVRRWPSTVPTRMLVAGGTDLYPNMKRRQFEPKMLVGLRGVARAARRRAARRARA